MYKYCVYFYVNHDEYIVWAELLTSKPIVNVEDDCVITCEGDVRFDGTISEIILEKRDNKNAHKIVYKGEER